ncbi:hypothetical protein [Enhygromyxa salina]|uniref:Uncharacterized protein n=1 Tax=Enhygromyxa salina TaxID=215803 RepID=A0A2S9YR74_9BACT|nr:hypothetical protein [Enhygromyxa salina]PRQ07580.1 hypothetical protein ENSA7_25700 [Enhygromyxa salina]
MTRLPISERPGLTERAGLDTVRVIAGGADDATVREATHEHLIRSPIGGTTETIGSEDLQLIRDPVTAG